MFRSSGFTAENIDLTGNCDTATGAFDSALMVRNIEWARLCRLRVAGHRNGISLLDTCKIEVQENSFSNLRIDGIQLWSRN